MDDHSVYLLEEDDEGNGDSKKSKCFDPLVEMKAEEESLDCFDEMMQEEQKTVHATTNSPRGRPANTGDTWWIGFREWI